MENDNVKDCWMAFFNFQNRQTEIDFTEVVISKKILLKPFVKWYLKKRQKRYRQDLEKALASEPYV